MKTITISSSLKNIDQIKITINTLNKIGINGLFPNLDNPVAKEDVDENLMKRIESEHFKAVDESDGLYVICPGGMVGTLVSVEIGYASARGIPVIFSEAPEDLGLKALSSGIVQLENLEKLKTFDKIGN